MDIALVPYSPLGRGFLTGAITTVANLEDQDFRKTNPRFQPGNIERNLELAEQVKAIAAAKGCTASQLALAWLLAQWDRIVPIPGTRRIANLDNNVGAADVALSAAELRQIAAIFPPGAAAGARYA
jgi:aryl-alcohol dehydrogenase-like predicted oxidoreductase